MQSVILPCGVVQLSNFMLIKNQRSYLDTNENRIIKVINRLLTVMRSKFTSVNYYLTDTKNDKDFQKDPYSFINRIAQYSEFLDTIPIVFYKHYDFFKYKNWALGYVRAKKDNVYSINCLNGLSDNNFDMLYATGSEYSSQLKRLPTNKMTIYADKNGEIFKFLLPTSELTSNSAISLETFDKHTYRRINIPIIFKDRMSGDFVLPLILSILIIVISIICIIYKFILSLLDKFYLTKSYPYSSDVSKLRRTKVTFIFSYFVLILLFLFGYFYYTFKYFDLLKMLTNNNFTLLLIILVQYVMPFVIAVISIIHFIRKVY